jgi:hypothetical protein
MTVGDRRQGGKEKCTRSSLNICGATLHLAQINHMPMGRVGFARCFELHISVLSCQIISYWL